MAIIDLFSKRQKVLRNEVPDVYQYDPHTHSTEGSDYPTRAAVGNLGSLIGSHPLSSQARQIFGWVRPRTGGSSRWDYLLTLSHNKHFLVSDSDGLVFSIRELVRKKTATSRRIRKAVNAEEIQKDCQFLVTMPLPA